MIYLPTKTQRSGLLVLARIKELRCEQKLNAAKAWLKGETVLRSTSRYCLDHPVLRPDRPPTADELAAWRSYNDGLVETFWSIVAQPAAQRRNGKAVR